MIRIDKYEIDDSRSRNKNQFKTKCPKCIELGKTHSSDTCLSVNMNKKVVNCHKCGWHGYFGIKSESKPKKEYRLPETRNLTQLSQNNLNFFLERGITQETVARNQIKNGKGDWFAFVYYEGEVMVNMKYRKGREKQFMQAGEAKPTMYKYNDIVGQNEIIICEGEFDALSWEEAGFKNATSVNQGAPNANDSNVDAKLDCVYNCFDIFEQAEWIYLCVDTDANGQRLQKELIKIFTSEKIKLIDCGIYERHDGSKCKDANDVLLLSDGRAKLRYLYETAKEIKQDGIFECVDFENEILDAYNNGQPRGLTTHIDEIDPFYTHRVGEVTVWSGYNNEGKSLFLKYLLTLKSHFCGWRHAIYSPEEMPLSEWYTDLIEMYIGKSADKYKQQYGNYMTEMQLKEGIKFVQKHFYAVYPPEDQTIDEILKRFSYLVRKQNINTVVLDPYNQIQHMMASGEREDLYISRFMAKLKRFAVDHEVAVHLVAHQVTPKFTAKENYPEPNLYSIKGGGTFADKADNIIAIWRENRNTDQSDTSVTFISQKIKKQKLTGIPGRTTIDFNRNKNRYEVNGRSPLDDKVEPEQQLLSIQPNLSHDDIEKGFYGNIEARIINDDSDCPF